MLYPQPTMKGNKMSINFTDYEMSAKELAFTESIMKDLDMSLGHDEYDYITNNSWT